jgi:hypothetical protein
LKNSLTISFFLNCRLLMLCGIPSHHVQALSMMDARSWSWREYIFLLLSNPLRIHILYVNILDDGHDILNITTKHVGGCFWISYFIVMTLVSYCLKYHLKARLKCFLCGLFVHFITLIHSFLGWLLIWFNFFLAAIHDCFCIAFC